MSAAPADVRLDRIGVVMTSTIGNTVHVLPVLNALKRSRPGARVTWIMQPGPDALVRGHPAVDDIVKFDRNRGWRGLASLRRELAARPFDLVLDFQVYLKASLVTGLTRAPVKLGFDRRRAKELNWLFTTHRVPPRGPRHMQDRYFEFLDYLGVTYGAPEWNLGPWPDERPAQQAFFAELDRPAVALVTSGSRPHNAWVPERWAELVDVLYDDFGLQPLLVGGRSPRELDVERVIGERSGRRVISRLGVPLRQSVGLLDGAALVISVDTGPLHLAVALGRPVIALMGYYHPLRVGPYRRFHDLMIDAFHDPGESTPISYEARPGRTLRITVADVREKVALAMERYADPGPVDRDVG